MAILSHELFAAVLPLAMKWAEDGQARILQQGQPLSVGQQNDARLAGVVHPERIRVWVVPAIPKPEDGLLKAVNDIVQLVGPNTAGLTLENGIFIRADGAGNRKLWVHEFVHTAQHERLGGIKNFLQQYLEQILKCGYSQAPLEQEAIQTSERICAE